jgi:hypothetical protein
LEGGIFRITSVKEKTKVFSSLPEFLPYFHRISLSCSAKGHTGEGDCPLALWVMPLLIV